MNEELWRASQTGRIERHQLVQCFVLTKLPRSSGFEGDHVLVEVNGALGLEEVLAQVETLEPERLARSSRSSDVDVLAWALVFEVSFSQENEALVGQFVVPETERHFRSGEWSTTLQGGHDNSESLISELATV